MNGVVDERSSACTSCHMAAQWPSVAPMNAPEDWARARCWFRNLDERYPFGFAPDGQRTCADPRALAKIWSIDFSLQLAIALRNWSLERAREGKTIATAVGKLRRKRDTLTVDGFKAEVLRR